MKIKKNLNLLSNICLGLALIMTVYNFLIVESPVPKQVTGLVLVLLIASNVMTNYKQSN